MNKRQVIQDGSTFYFKTDQGMGDRYTAPLRIWQPLEHDSLDSEAACRKWFVGYCAKADIEPVFDAAFIDNRENE